MADFKAAFPNLQAVQNDKIFLEPGGVWGWSGISAEKHTAAVIPGDASASRPFPGIEYTG
jgi:hypothetical protein